LREEEKQRATELRGEQRGPERLQQSEGGEKGSSDRLREPAAPLLQRRVREQLGSPTGLCQGRRLKCR